MRRLRPVEPERRPLLPFRLIGGQHGDDVVDAAGDAAAVVAGLEARRDGVGDDHGGEGIGQRAFQAIAHFDAHPPFLGRHQQQHAVVLVLLAELPEAEQLVGIGLDLLALERVHRGDDELDARLLLELGELGLQRLARLLRDDVGLVDDAPVSGGKVSASATPAARASATQNASNRVIAGSAPLRGASLSQQCMSATEWRAPSISHFPNFTCGGFCASSLAVNSAIGLLPRIMAQIWPGKVLISVL